jgi:hypothetical protein
MGAIRRTRDGRLFYLRYQQVIGRGATCDLSLRISSVSTQHAMLRWHSERWVVSDLSSRNGTFVNGQRLVSGSANARELKCGDELAFAERDEVWIVVQDGAPEPLLVQDGGGAPLALSLSQVSALPSEQRALVFVYHEGGSWKLEDELGNPRELREDEPVVIDGQTYRLRLPGTATETAPSENPIAERLLDDAKLEVVVAPDEESAAVVLDVSGERLKLQPRTHLYLLAYLARERMRAISRHDAGWVPVEQACRDLALSPELLAVMVFRCRREFEQLAFIEATRIVDRSRRGLLRIGVGAERLSVRVA